MHPSETAGQRARSTDGGSDEVGERTVDIYDPADNLPAEESAAEQRPGSIVCPVKSLPWVFTVCLLLLCALLLAAVTALAVQCPQLWLQSLSRTCTQHTKETLFELSRFCETGCAMFNNSFYYVSAELKSWEDSRQDCLERGADLVVINSQDEQKFINSFKKIMWLGLSDRGERGNWTWVDGTRLDTGFWGHGEPGREHCAYTYWFNNLNSWSDDKCAKRCHWICEKLLDF
ncbi:CD209 antigen-like protein E [Myripristis murdjan]|uniref:CD209 antigen-like protein E n=1 Tax=Myripristis murdjan TaxID=586833 RepID=UPI001175CF72|nr:CD209 antigen-like protein E [Myripristis murdjan]